MHTNTGYPVEPPPAPADHAALLVRNLAATAGWLQFMAIVGFIGAGFMAVAGLILLLTGLPGGSFGGRFIGLIYLPVAALYLIPLLPLYRCASATSTLKLTPTMEIAAVALHHQRIFWRRIGILTIVGLGLSLLSIPIALIVGLALR